MRNSTEHSANRGIWMACLLVASLAIPAAAVAASSDLFMTATVAAVIGLILVFAIALTRFELLTFLMIAARTAIDITHSSDSEQGVSLSAIVTGAYTLTALVWLLARRIRRPLRLSKVAIAAIAVAVAASLSGALSTDREQALLGASRWVFLAVFLVVLENLIVDEKRVHRLLIAICVSTVVPLGLGTWQLLAGGGRVIDGIMRIEGSFAHPNSYGFYLAVVGIGLIALIGHIPRLFRVVGLALLPVILINLVATFSRTSYVAFVVGVFAVAFLARRWALLAFTVAAVSAMPLIPGVSERFADLGEGTTLRGTPGDSLSWRIDYWEDVINAGEGWRVTGLGLGVVSDTTEQGREPHNDLLRAYVELGVIGLVAFLSFLLALGWHIRRALSGAPSASGSRELPRALVIGNAGIFSAYLVGSITGNLMTQLILLMYVVAFAAAAGPSTRCDIGDAKRALAPSHV